MKMTDAEDYKKLREWTDKAMRCDTNNSPNLELLISVLSGGVFLTAYIAPDRDERGRALIGLGIAPPKGYEDQGQKDRFMHPVHAAITRVLEWAGAKIEHQRPDDKGKDRFRLWLHIGDVNTTLSRILFGTPSSGRLNERKSEPGFDYRQITPAQSYYSRSPDREEVLAEVQKREGDSIAKLLADLFVLADRWHKDDLEIRV